MIKYGMPNAQKIKNRSIGKVSRMLCTVLCLALLLATCVGCTSYASTADVSALKKDLNDALAQIDSMGEEYAAALQEIELLKSNKEAADKALEELGTEYESKISSLDSANKSASQKLDLLTESYQSAQQKIDSLTGALNDARDELGSVKESYDEAQQEIDDLKSQIEDLQNGIIPDYPTTEKIKIYIDQGHNPTGFHNAGAVGNDLYEQDLTYTIGKLLSTLLKNDGRFEIRLSRPTANTVLGTDNDSSLDARVQGAIDFGADYFISLHTNSFTDGAANGIEVYTANREGEAYSFGSCLLDGLIKSTELRNRGMKLNSELRVLKNATMPAVLLEMGFISNEQDSSLLSTRPELFAQGIYNGILEYFELEPVNADEN